MAVIQTRGRRTERTSETPDLIPGYFARIDKGKPRLKYETKAHHVAMIVIHSSSEPSCPPHVADNL